MCFVICLNCMDQAEARHSRENSRQCSVSCGRNKKEAVLSLCGLLLPFCAVKLLPVPLLAMEFRNLIKFGFGLF